MTRVLVTTGYLRPGGEVDLLLREAGIETVFASDADRQASGRTLADHVADVDGVLAGIDTFDAAVFDAGTRLKIVARCGVGYDNVDVSAATRNGVAVTSTPGVNTRTVAEHTLALMLNCARGIPQNVAAVRAGRWSQPSGRELYGTTLGVVGFGTIGKAVGQLAEAVGMRVVAYDAYLDTGRSLNELLAVSDFVSLHTPLDRSSRHLIGAAELARMKPNAYLINTARGGIVDEDALAEAVEHGALAGAALDVTEQEPLPADSRLRKLDNVIVTAHIGGATTEARSRSSLMAARQVIDRLRGESPDHLVNPEVH